MGGAVKVIEGSTATFINPSFRDNSSPNRGGALSVRSSEVTIQGGELVNNRTNVPGHKANAAGGAIMVQDGRLSVTGARFEGNQAGWVGGAIYALGTWSKGSEVLVANSTFVDNQALADPCCAHSDPTTGGVTASYAMLGDIQIAEPGALIGFAGQRVIEQTIREKLPEGFQRAEYLLEHGMIDMVVPRHELAQRLARVQALDRVMLALEGDRALAAPERGRLQPAPRAGDGRRAQRDADARHVRDRHGSGHLFRSGAGDRA